MFTQITQYVFLIVQHTFAIWNILLPCHYARLVDTCDVRESSAVGELVSLLARHFLRVRHCGVHVSIRGDDVGHVAQSCAAVVYRKT